MKRSVSDNKSPHWGFFISGRQHEQSNPFHHHERMPERPDGGTQVQPVSEITFRDKEGLHKHKISSGRADEIHVFRENGVTMVLSRNPRLEYAGLEAFEGDEKINDVFLTGSELLAAIGEDDLEPARMIHVLKEWI